MNIITLYHGTDPATAVKLLNCKVDISIGGGEFGKGFYLGTSKRLAKRRAFHKTEGSLGTAQQAMRSNNKNTFMVQFERWEIEKTFSQLVLNRNDSISLYHRIKSAKVQSSYLSNRDYIVGIIVGTKRYYDITQYKFESDKSEKVFNNHISMRSYKNGLI